MWKAGVDCGCGMAVGGNSMLLSAKGDLWSACLRPVSYLPIPPMVVVVVVWLATSSHLLCSLKFVPPSSLLLRL